MLLKKLRSKISLCMSIILMVVPIINAQPLLVKAADEYETLRLKYFDSLTGGSSFDPNNPDLATKIDKIDGTARALWNSMNSNKVWSPQEIDSLTNPAYLSAMFGNLKSMALGWTVQGSIYYHDTTMLNDIIAGLDWLIANRYNPTIPEYSNWYDWDIGVPGALADTTVLLYDQLTTAKISSYMDAIAHYLPAPFSTAANRADTSKITVIRGILSKDSAIIQSGSDGLDSVFPYVTQGDGFYADGSFIQHTYYPYVGSYGNGLLSSVSKVMWLLYGTTWAVDAPQKDNVFNWVFDSYEPNIYKGLSVLPIRGRHAYNYSPDTVMTANGLLYSMLYLADLPGNSYSTEIKRLIKYQVQNGDENYYYSKCGIWEFLKSKSFMEDVTLAPRSELIGNWQYNNQDTVIHSRRDWRLALRMHSERIANFEMLLNQNLKGWYYGDGVTFMYQGEKDYTTNYLYTVDNHRLPGITVDIDRSRPNLTVNGTRSDKKFVGGVTLDKTYGVSSMDFKQHDYSNMDVSAKKSWFMFDDEVVCLGSDINSTSGRTIETVIENRAINSEGNNPFIVNGTLKPKTLGWSETMTGINWAHLKGTGGYYFPGSATVKGLREERSGESMEVNPYNAYPGTDQFNSTTLNASWGWSRPDNSAWNLTGTTMRIASQQGSLKGTSNSTKNILRKVAPRGDYNVTSKLTFSPSQAGQEAGVIIYTDEDNYVYISRAYTSTGNIFQVVNEVDGETTINNINASMDPTVYLKIDKSEDDYSLYASNDGISWNSPIYTYSHAFSWDPYIGVFSQNGNTATPSINADFDYIEIKHTNNFLTAWIDHGVDPVNQSYSYALLPRMSSSEVSEYAENPQINILENSSSVHAVKKASLGLIGATFWEDTGDSIEYISSQTGSTVMAKDIDNEITIAVSDPTHRRNKMVFELNKHGVSIISKDPEINVLQLTPTIKFEVDTSKHSGGVFNAKFSYDTNSGIPNSPTGVIQSVSSNKIDLSWDNTPGASSYNVYRTETTGSDYTQITSSVTDATYSDITIEEGHSYYYVIGAVNENGQSSYSPEAVSSLLIPLVDDDFNDLSIGEDPKVWSIGGGLGPDCAAAAVPSISNKSILFNDTKIDESVSARRWFKDIKAGKFVAEWKFMQPETKQVTTRFRLQEQYTFNVSLDISANSNNTLTYKTSTGGTPTILTLTPGNWYTIKAEVDMDNKKYDLYVDGVKQLSQVSFNNTGSSVIHFLEIVTDKAGTGATYIDDVNIYEIPGSIPAPLPPSTIVLNPIDDSTIRTGSYADTNFGLDKRLTVRNASGNNGRQSYVKFDLSSITGKILSAKLGFFGAISDGNGLTTTDIGIYSVDDDTWTNTGITWNTKPNVGILLDTLHPSRSAAYSVVESVYTPGFLDYVQSQYNSDKTLSLGVIQTSTSAWTDFNSSNNTSNKPYLQIVTSNIPEIDSQAPSVPSSVYATPVSISQINLTWSAATDNTGIAGYVIYRGTNQLATVTNNVYSYSDSGLTPSTLYNYTIKAYDTEGNVSAASVLTQATTWSSICDCGKCKSSHIKCKGGTKYQCVDSICNTCK